MGCIWSSEDRDRCLYCNQRTNKVICESCVARHSQPRSAVNYEIRSSVLSLQNAPRAVPSRPITTTGSYQTPRAQNSSPSAVPFRPVKTTGSYQTPRAQNSSPSAVPFRPVKTTGSYQTPRAQNSSPSAVPFRPVKTTGSYQTQQIKTRVFESSKTTEELKPQFGEYRCSCGRYWTSRLSWACTYQICERCRKPVYPKNQRDLRPGDYLEDKDALHEHPKEFCQKCQQLGSHCGNYRKKSEKFVNKSKYSNK